jgi:hypothetical protein
MFELPYLRPAVTLIWSLHRRVDELQREEPYAPLNLPYRLVLGTNLLSESFRTEDFAEALAVFTRTASDEFSRFEVTAKTRFVLSGPDTISWCARVSERSSNEPHSLVANSCRIAADQLDVVHVWRS